MSLVSSLAHSFLERKSSFPFMKTFAAKLPGTKLYISTYSKVGDLRVTQDIELASTMAAEDEHEAYRLFQECFGSDATDILIEEV